MSGHGEARGVPGTLSSRSRLVEVMRTVSMKEAKRKLSRLVDAAADGEPFIISRAGKPVVKVVAVEAPESGAVRRIGFLDGQIVVPGDFDRRGSDEIEAQFEGGE